MRKDLDSLGSPSAGHASSGATQHDADAGPGRPKLRAVFVSDIHLGTPGCDAAALLDFLEHHPSERLYLVGDIVDGWQLRRRWFWPELHSDVVRKFIRCAGKGCRVVFVPGNHDEFARRFAGQCVSGIEIEREVVHVTADGRELWVIHGDGFDSAVLGPRWLAHIGSDLYQFTLRINRHLNRVRASIGLPHWSLPGFLRRKIKHAVNQVVRFEHAVAREAQRRGHDGVVCGHIHRAEMRDIEGILYCNDGDWVESRTGLVEHQGGRLEVVHWGTVSDPVAARAVQALDPSGTSALLQKSSRSRESLPG